MKTAILKLTSAIVVAGEVLRAGSLVEVTRDEATDLLSRGKATLHTLDTDTDTDADADAGEQACDQAAQDAAQDAGADAGTGDQAATTDAAQTAPQAAAKTGKRGK